MVTFNVPVVEEIEWPAEHWFNNITMQFVNSNVLLFVGVTQKMTPKDWNMVCVWQGCITFY